MCFFAVFEEEIHRVIVDNQLFKPGERIAIGASGGKGDECVDARLLQFRFWYRNKCVCLIASGISKNMNLLTIMLARKNL